MTYNDLVINSDNNFLGASEWCKSQRTFQVTSEDYSFYEILSTNHGLMKIHPFETWFPTVDKLHEAITRFV